MKEGLKMTIIPNSNIYLLKVPINIDNKNQLTFESKQSQFDYFSSLPHLNISDAKYQRKDNVIRYPRTF